MAAGAYFVLRSFWSRNLKDERDSDATNYLFPLSQDGKFSYSDTFYVLI